MPVVDDTDRLFFYVQKKMFPIAFPPVPPNRQVGGIDIIPQNTLFLSFLWFTPCGGLAELAES
ncbi:MAG: hypothetical protein SPJ02_04020, partial [Parabacteroides sp.]|nr:hypothetical protein [Parabacteroides sp.]